MPGNGPAAGPGAIDASRELGANRPEPDDLADDLFVVFHRAARFAGMILMRGSFGLSTTGKIAIPSGMLSVAAVAFALALLLAPDAAHAQGLLAPPPPPPPVPSATSMNATQSAGNAVANLGSSFLERLGNQASHGFGNTLRNNPNGGGASEATDTPLLFRSWAEAYGISTTDGAQGVFLGDHRRTAGGVAGLGATLAPGVNVGISVDQSRTDIDVPLALQSASLDLTQFGFNASVDKGPWTWAMAVVHGVGQIDSQPRYRLWPGERRLYRPGRRRADRTQLLLDAAGAEPDRAEGRLRICPRHDRRLCRDRRARPGDGERHDNRARAHFARCRGRPLPSSSTGRSWISRPTANSSTT